MLAVGTTWVRVTWVGVHNNRLLRDELTCREWVSSVTRVTGADWVVVPDRTLSIAATGSWTWVLTLLLDTGKVVRTLSVDEALWATPNIGVTDVILDTFARPCSVS
jgi:hypothetical protein